MKIGIDGGALCSSPEARYGTYRFTQQLLAALERYGSHSYTVYQFCSPEKTLSNKITYVPVTPAFAWHHLRLPVQLQNDGIPVFLGLNQVSPSFYSGKKIVFSHGLSFHLFPSEYREDFFRLEAQLQQYLKTADTIIVSSERVKQELVNVEPGAEEKIVSIPFGLDIDPLPRKPEKYFLYVGSSQRIKQVEILIDCVDTVRKKTKQDFQLVLAGTNLEITPPFVKQIPHAGWDQLAKLYAGAQAYLSSSQYESFNYPIVEALMHGCPVIAFDSATIPEQKPFVTQVSSAEEMVDMLSRPIEHAVPLATIKRVKEVFSWKRYVATLEELYI